MNKRILKALKGSICKWNLICMGVETNRTSSNCPLCIECRSCWQCPVKEKSEERGCDGTPWEEWNRKIYSSTGEMIPFPNRNLPWLIEHTNHELSEQLIDLAWDELEFLITLLPEGHPWREML